MKYIRTYEGLFDFFKKNKNTFTTEEITEFKNNLIIDQLVQIHEVFHDGKKVAKSIEVFVGRPCRWIPLTASLSPQYILITKQDGEYKVISFEDVHSFANDYNARLKRYTKEEAIQLVKKIVLYCLVAPFIEPPFIPNLKWNQFQVDENKFRESKSLVEDYSVIDKNGKLNIERLKMLLDDYFIFDEESLKDEFNEKTVEKMLSIRESSIDSIVSILENYFEL